MNVTAWSNPLPWHYLAAVHNLIHGRPVGGRNLIAELLRLSDQDLRTALAKDQQGNAPGGLFDRVRGISAPASKVQYSWTIPWPSGLQVCIRRGAADLALSPSQLVIPWPFPGDRPLPVGPMKELEARLEQVQPGSIPNYPGLNHNSDLYLDQYMKAADVAALGDAGFKRVKGDCAAEKAWIETKAGMPTPHAELTVCAEDQLETYRTSWDLRNGRLHLRLGWKQAVTSCPQQGFSGWLKRAIRILMALLRLRFPWPYFDSWPTGYICE